MGHARGYLLGVGVYGVSYVRKIVGRLFQPQANPVCKGSKDSAEAVALEELRRRKDSVS